MMNNNFHDLKVGKILGVDLHHWVFLTTSTMTNNIRETTLANDKLETTLTNDASATVANRIALTTKIQNQPEVTENTKNGLNLPVTSLLNSKASDSSISTDTTMSQETKNPGSNITSTKNEGGDLITKPPVLISNSLTTDSKSTASMISSSSNPKNVIFPAETSSSIESTTTMAQAATSTAKPNELATVFTQTTKTLVTTSAPSAESMMISSEISTNMHDVTDKSIHPLQEISPPDTQTIQAITDMLSTDSQTFRSEISSASSGTTQVPDGVISTPSSDLVKVTNEAKITVTNLSLPSEMPEQTTTPVVGTRIVTESLGNVSTNVIEIGATSRQTTAPELTVNTSKKTWASASENLWTNDPPMTNYFFPQNQSMLGTEYKSLGQPDSMHQLPFILACIVGSVIILLILIGCILTTVCLKKKHKRQVDKLIMTLTYRQEPTGATVHPSLPPNMPSTTWPSVRNNHDSATSNDRVQHFSYNLEERCSPNLRNTTSIIDSRILVEKHLSSQGNGALGGAHMSINEVEDNMNNNNNNNVSNSMANIHTSHDVDYASSTLSTFKPAAPSRQRTPLQGAGSSGILNSPFENQSLPSRQAHRNLLNDINNTRSPV